MNDLTFWLWVYRIAVVGIACILSYSCWKLIRRTIKIAREIRELKKELSRLFQEK